MKTLKCLLAAALLCGVSVSHADARILKFVRAIGPGWHVEKPAWMSFVAFSRDGKMIASDAPATGDDTSGDLTLWRFPEGSFVRRVQGRPFALSPDWRYFANEHNLLSLAAGSPIVSTKGDRFATYAFSADSRFAAVAATKKETGDPAIRVIELPGGTQGGAFGHSSPFSLAFSPRGKLLAAGYWDIVTLWDTATRKRAATLRGLGRYVASLSFSRDGRLLAAGGDWGVLQIWDVRKRVRLHTISIDGADVSTPAFSPDGKLIAVGTYGSGEVWVIDVRTGNIRDHRKISDLGCGSVAFSPDGRYLATPSTGGLVTWPYDVGGTIRVFRVGTH
jgi:WD40 repeat protein